MHRTRHIGLLGWIAAAILAAALAGCRQVPEYRRPAGYSSTYHRHLRESQALLYGEVLYGEVIPPEAVVFEGPAPSRRHEENSGAPR